MRKVGVQAEPKNTPAKSVTLLKEQLEQFQDGSVNSDIEITNMHNQSTEQVKPVKYPRTPGKAFDFGSDQRTPGNMAFESGFGGEATFSPVSAK